LSRNSLGVPFIKGGNNLLFKGLIDAKSRLGILSAGIFINGPSIFPIVAFAPPSIEHTAIGDSIESGLLTACPTRLPRRQRSVEPDVHSLDQVKSDMFVIFFDEGQAALELGRRTGLKDLLQLIFSGFVVRMGLAGEDDSNRSPRIVKKPFQAFTVAE
jgi:hypothetical protein